MHHCRTAPARFLLPLAALLTMGLATAQPAAPKPPARKGAPPPKVEAPLPPAPGEQVAAAAMAHFGVYQCEFNESVSVDDNRKFDGYIDVRHRKNLWTMKPVLSQTGALRLEDVKGRMLMLQIADKSMLMDTQIGQRLVDNCVHEKQREATLARKAAGTQAESIGIDPARAAAPAAAVAPATAPATAAAPAATAAPAAPAASAP